MIILIVRKMIIQFTFILLSKLSLTKNFLDNSFKIYNLKKTYCYVLQTRIYFCKNIIKYYKVIAQKKLYIDIIKKQIN